MLSEEEIRQLANGTGSIYHFDFSKISGDKYKPLLCTLQHFAKKKVESIGFSCDELFKAQQRSLSGHQMPIYVLNSIAKTQSHYVRNIIELLCLVLPRSNRLKEIVLSNLNIKKESLSRLIEAMSHSPSLENINLSKMPIGDDVFNLMLQKLDPNQIKCIMATHCGITRNCVDSIISFIGRKDQQITKNGGISQITLSKTEIPNEDQRRIQEALGIADQSDSNTDDKINEYYNRIRDRSQNEKMNSQFNIKYDQLTDNESSLANSQVEHLPKLEKASQYKIKDQKNQKQISMRDQKIKEKENQRNEEKNRLKELQKRNSELIQTLNQMRSSLHAIQYDEETFIIGQGAEQFIEFIHAVESKIKALEERKITNNGKL